MKAVILAAGEGKRLLPFTNLIPKPLMPIGIDSSGTFVVIIERLVKQLIVAQIQEIVIVFNYKGEMLKEYLGDGSRYGCRLSYTQQKKLDGNAGAFFCAQPFIGKDDVLITDCDQYLPNIKVFKDMRTYFYQTVPEILVGVGHVKNIAKYAIIKTKEDVPTDIYEKPQDKSWGNLAKSGVMILTNAVAKLKKEISYLDNEYTTTAIVKYGITNNLKVGLFQLQFTDIGSWEEYIDILKLNLKG